MQLLLDALHLNAMKHAAGKLIVIRLGQQRLARRHEEWHYESKTLGKTIWASAAFGSAWLLLLLLDSIRPDYSRPAAATAGANSKQHHPAPPKDEDFDVIRVTSNLVMCRRQSWMRGQSVKGLQVNDFA